MAQANFNSNKSALLTTEKNTVPFNFSSAEEVIFADDFFNKGNFFEFKILTFTKKAFTEFTDFFTKNVGNFQQKKVKFTFLFQNLEQFDKFSSQFNKFIKTFSAKNPENFEFSVIPNADDSAFSNTNEDKGFNFQFGFPNQDFVFSAHASNR